MSIGDQRLGEALAAEHAAIFGYGALGAHLAGAELNAARQAEAAHRVRRDALLVLLANKGVNAPPAEPAYALPFAVTDRPSALRLAVQIEVRAAAIWRQALPDTVADERKTALDALVGCARQATRWRMVAGQQPATVALPGATS